MTWWDAFFAAVASPTWLASLLQTVLGTAIALVGAAVILRRQLKHDRLLAVEQMMADRRATAASDLGRAVLDAARQSDLLTTNECVRDLLAHGVNHRTTPGGDLLSAARNLAGAVLDLDETLTQLWREREWVWDAGKRLARLKGGLSAEQEVIDLMADAVEARLSHSKTRLGTLGRALCRWDGRGEVPGASSLADWAPDLRRLSNAVKAEHDAALLSEYNAIAERRVARQAIRAKATPPVAQP